MLSRKVLCQIALGRRSLDGRCVRALVVCMEDNGRASVRFLPVSNSVVETPTKMPKKRTTAGKVALPVFFVTVVCISVAFSTTYWLENWAKYYGDKFDKLGLWVHCFRSLPDPNDVNHLRFFTGCRWMFNPFTDGYQEMRGFLTPRKMHSLSF